MRYGKKVLAMLLCLCMIATLLPAPLALAAEGSGQDDKTLSMAAGGAADFIEGAGEPAEAEEFGEAASAVDASSAGADEPAEAAGQDESSEESAPADDEPLLTGELPGQVWLGEDLDEGRELLEGYIQSVLYAGQPASGRTPVKAPKNLGGRLQGLDAVIYKKAAAAAEAIAAGTESSSVVSIPVDQLGLERLTWTAEDLGLDPGQPLVENGSFTPQAIAAIVQVVSFDLESILNALLADKPFELYWFDKTKGTVAGGCGFTGNSQRISLVGAVTLYLPVAEGYSDGSTQSVTVNGETRILRLGVDESTGTRITIARTNIDEILGESAGLSVHGKLRHYAAAICRLVEYNRPASLGGVPYGDPWQLINIFDNDTNTKVVCEGYSKAFQYLCDMGMTKDAMFCYCVTGRMGQEAHMWNIVTMENGLNYLVDVTNSDQGTELNEARGLFLAGYQSGSVAAGYQVGGLHYDYDVETLSLYTTQELTLSDKAYESSAGSVVLSEIAVTLFVDDIFQLSATVLPSGSSQRVSFESSDETVATVDGNGWVNAVAPGEAVITVTEESGQASAQCLVTVLRHELAAPELVSAVNAVSGVLVSWKGVEWAEMYRIYRKTPGGKWTLLAKRYGLSYVDSSAESGAEYLYTVRAQRGDDIGPYDAAGLSIVRLAAPGMLSIINVRNGVKVSWEKVEGAELYRLYRKAPGGGWSLLAKRVGQSYVDTSAESGVSYSYMVRAQAGDATSGYEAAGISILCLAAPQMLYAKTVSGGVKLSWQTVPGAEIYRVYRKSPGGDWTLIARRYGTVYTDTAAPAGASCSYMVRAQAGEIISSYDPAGIPVQGD